MAETYVAEVHPNGHSYEVEAYRGLEKVGSVFISITDDADILMDWNPLTQAAPRAVGVWLSNLRVGAAVRRQGVATRLVTHALKLAKRRGATHGWTDEHVTLNGEKTIKKVLTQMGATFYFKRPRRNRAHADFYWKF